MVRGGARAQLAVGCVAWLFAASGCDRTASARAFCELAVEHEVARTVAKDFDGIDLVAFGGGAVAFWSVASGLFAQAIGPDGAARGPNERLGVRCEGGLTALADGDAIEVACLVHPRHGKHDDPGGVLLHRVGADLHVQRTRFVEGAGDQSEGVALARGASGIELAWHDGSADDQRVLWTRPYGPVVAPRALSERGRIAQAPNLIAAGRRVLVTWAENWIDDGGELASRVVAWDGTAAPRTVLDRAHVAAMPQWFALGREIGLAYRDRISAGARTGLYLAKLDQNSRRLGPAVRAGRADGVGKPAIEPCMRGVVAATPRTYGGDYFVGVNWLDGTLQRARGEQQFYEDSHAFTQVAAACLGGHALLLIAEFPQLHRESTALRAVPYHCR